MSMWKTIRFLSTVAPIALGGCAGVSGEFGDQSALSYESAKTHYAAGRYGLAIKGFQSAIDWDSNSVEALNGLAASYDQLGRYDLAARYYGRALAVDPGSTQTLNNIGYSYLLQKRFDLAVAYLRDAHKQERGSAVVLANRKNAEVALQDADLKRSAEISQKTVVTNTLSAKLSKQKEATPWIERTASKVQTVVTEPQMAFVGAAQDLGLDPSLAAFRPESAVLPDPVSAPIATGLLIPETNVALREDEIAADEVALLESRNTVALRNDAAAVETALPVEQVATAVRAEGVVTEPLESLGQAATVATPDEVALAEELSWRDSTVVVAELEEAPAAEKIEWQEPVVTLAAQEEMPAAEKIEWQEPVVILAALEETPAAEKIDWQEPVVTLAAQEETPVAEEIDWQEPVASVAALEEGTVTEEIERSEPTVSTMARESSIVFDDLNQVTYSLAFWSVAPEKTVAVASLELPESTAATATRADAIVANDINLLEPVAIMAARENDAAVENLEPSEEGQEAPAAAISLNGIGIEPLIELSNGNGRENMATRMRGYLADQGIDVAHLTNANHYSHMETTIFFRDGWQEYARTLARMLPVAVDLARKDNQRSDVRIELGGDLLSFDRELFYVDRKSSKPHSG